MSSLNRQDRIKTPASYCHGYSEKTGCEPVIPSSTTFCGDILGNWREKCWYREAHKGNDETVSLPFTFGMLQKSACFTKTQSKID